LCKVSRGAKNANVDQEREVSFILTFLFTKSGRRSIGETCIIALLAMVNSLH
jgi:hypothetical protein